MQRFFTTSILVMLFFVFATTGFSKVTGEQPTALTGITQENTQGAGSRILDVKQQRWSKMETHLNKTTLPNGIRRLVPQTYATIQQAINASSHGDTVLVSDGLYYENIRFRGKAIVVASLFLIDGDTLHIEKTIIDGSKSTFPDSVSVVYFINGEDTTSVLYGFTIRGGAGTYYYSSQLGKQRLGGGIMCDGVRGATIKYNHITGNRLYGDVAFGAATEFFAPHGYLIFENNKVFANHIKTTVGIGWGGGLDVWSDSVFARIVNNVFERDTVIAKTYAVGGGLSMGGDSIFTDGLIKGNVFRNNMVEASLNNGVGGAIYFTFTGPMLIENNLFEGNLARSINGSASGGGLQPEDSDKPLAGRKTIKGNRFINNKCVSLYGSLASGGGLNLYRSKALVIGNYFSKNTVEGNDAMGGAINSYKSSFKIENNILAENSAEYGGTVYIYHDPQYGNEKAFINNTVVNNKASVKGGGIYVVNILVKVMNSIFWGNSALNGAQIYGINDVQYSDIQGGKNGTGNINADPLFVDMDNFYLSQGSPCIDAGNPDSYYNDLEDPNNAGFALWPALGTVRSDMGAHGGDPYHVTGFETAGTLPPFQFELKQNYPNPFNPLTTIEFQLSGFQNITLKIYNILGQEVTTLLAKKLKAGKYKVVWNAIDLSSGVYFCQLKTEQGQVQTRKLMLIK